MNMKALFQDAMPTGKEWLELMDGLTERERKVIVLIDWAELSQDEVGQHLGIDRSVVSRIRKEALEKIRKKFARNF